MTRSYFVTLASTVGVALMLSGVACSSSSEGETSATADCSSVTIDRFKELIVVDEGVLGDARAKNATGGAWSFRRQIEHLMPEGGDASTFVTSWLTGWVSTQTLNGYPLDRPGETRDAAMQTVVLCPWLHMTPENACDATCGSCKARNLDLAKAPFRLIAIANRIDQREENLAEPSGEGRFVYGLTTGPGDDPASLARPMSVIFEYELPSSRTPKEWAETWHALGQFAAFDEPYRAALESVTNAFSSRNAAPGRPNGSSLAQIRTNESTLNWIWQLREFGLTKDGALALRPVRNTPAESLNSSTALRDWINTNQASILSSTHEIPSSMRAGSSDQLLYSWTVPGVDEKTRKAFAANTCNGCHSTENPSIDTAFHISPFRKGAAKLSPFMNNLDGKPDDLSHRTASMQRALCTAK